MGKQKGTGVYSRIDPRPLFILMKRSFNLTLAMLLVAILIARSWHGQSAVSAGEPGNFARAQEPVDKPTTESSGSLSLESVERLKGIATGRSQIEPTREDLPLVMRALQDKDPDISSWACLAVEKMALRGLFQPNEPLALWTELRPKLRSAHAETSDWSVRAVGALVSRSELLADPLVEEALFEETLWLVRADDVNQCCRGAMLATALVMTLPKESKDNLEKLVRALLKVRVPMPANSEAQDAEATCNRLVTEAIRAAAGRVETQALLDDVALRLLAQIATINQISTLSGDHVYSELAALAGKTSKEVRDRIVQSILAAAANSDLLYSRTSGRYTPPKHAGAEALAVLASLLTREELEQAEAAIPPPAAVTDSEEYESMYGAAKEALAVRRARLDKKK